MDKSSRKRTHTARLLRILDQELVEQETPEDYIEERIARRKKRAQLVTEYIENLRRASGDVGDEDRRCWENGRASSAAPCTPTEDHANTATIASYDSR